MAWLVAVWATHAVLRFCVLFREDAYGFPFVGKPDWYIFHAFCIDWLWIAGWSLPFLTAAWWAGAAGRTYGARAALLALMSFHGILLLCTVVDQETQRFLGMHLEVSLLATYGNSAAGRDLFKFIASDESVRYLPLLLLVGCVPLSLWLFAWLKERPWASSDRVGRVPWVMAAAAFVAYLYLYQIWPGGFRMLKLRPYTQTLWQGLVQKRVRRPDPVPLDSLGAVFRRQWLSEQGDSGWVFPDTAFPFYKVPLEQYCADRARLGSAADPRCARDRDGDGFPAGAECDDGDPRARPGAREIPGNGVDEDCNGVDGKPPNIVLFLLESHRAVNAGFLRPFGALPGLPDSIDPTPVMDSLVRHGAHAWTRFSCSALPTINAVVALHMSILQHPVRNIANEFTMLGNRSFAKEFGLHGYVTRYVSAGDPAWDGKTPWLRQWYQGIDYDRSRENDRSMLRHLSRWMRDSLDGSRPFLITALTKTNHYPFNPEPTMPPARPGSSLQERMRATMHYTDASVGEFIASLRGQKWFSNTLFVLMADHGFPLAEHGSSTIGYGLYTESVWVPFVIVGSHPKLGPGALHDYPASQLDVGPTLLDLAGIRVPNSFLGHSLVRPATGLNSLSYAIRGEQGTLEHGDYRIHGPIGDRPREQGNQVFDTRQDRLETRDLFALPGPGKAAYDSLMPFLRTMARLNDYVVEANRLWPDTADSPARPDHGEPAL